ANRKQSLNYGCIVENQETNEKPSTFVSDIINCGIYLFTPGIFQHIAGVFQKNQQDILLEESSNGWHRAAAIRLEQDIFTALAGQGKLYVYKTLGFWSQIKSAGYCLYSSNGQYRSLCCAGSQRVHRHRGDHWCRCEGPGDHCCVLNCIVGWDSSIGKWARVEGTPSDPNPNDPYAKIDSETLFRDSKLTPSITILGCNVTIPSEVIILNSIVLPHKDLNRSFKNQIIL
ncbi:hypothetical protein CRUP_018433, partial [Coryphaenoides rupestris]